MNIFNTTFFFHKIDSTPLIGRKLKFLITIFGIVLISGCGRITPHSRTVEEIRVLLEPGDYKRVAYVQGEDCVGRYLILFRLNSPNIVNAAKNAMSSVPQANFLVNRHVSMQEKFIVPLIYHQVCVQIEGQAIQLLNEQGEVL